MTLCNTVVYCHCTGHQIKIRYITCPRSASRTIPTPTISTWTDVIWYQKRLPLYITSRFVDKYLIYNTCVCDFYMGAVCVDQKKSNQSSGFVLISTLGHLVFRLGEIISMICHISHISLALGQWSYWHNASERTMTDMGKSTMNRAKVSWMQSM